MLVGSKIKGGREGQNPSLSFFMKPYTLISFVFMILLSLIPPIDFVLRNPQHPYWLWMILTAGFFGVFILFIKTDLAVKVIALTGFLNCFFSAAPYISFTSYCSLILCCYFYVCATRIENWDFMFKAIQSIVILNVILLVLEFFHKDSLMDFGQVYTDSYGVLGHRMQMGSFSVVISALLISFSKFNILFALAVSLFCKSSWTFLSAGIGVMIYIFSKSKKFAYILLAAISFVFLIWGFSTHKFEENMGKSNGRVVVWKRSFQLANEHPWTGWGIGTYKQIFHPLSRIQSIPWKTAHNFIAELDFEVGHVLTGCLLLGLGCLLVALFKAELWLQLSGLCMILVDALVHFPDRMIQTVPLIIIFLAYCSFSLRRYS